MPDFYLHLASKDLKSAMLKRLGRENEIEDIEKKIENPQLKLCINCRTR